MLSRQRNQPSKITVHHNPKPQTSQIVLNLLIQPPRLRRLLPPYRRQPSRLILKRLPIILHRLNTDVPPLLDSRVRVLCATSRTTHSRSDHVRLPVARPLWIPAFAGMTGLCKGPPPPQHRRIAPTGCPRSGVVRNLTYDTFTVRSRAPPRCPAPLDSGFRRNDEAVRRLSRRAQFSSPCPLLKEG